MDKPMKKMLLIPFLLLTLSACNTLQGMGRDMQGAGEGIANGAERVKRNL